jgi:predicted house-cleaning noncanonical NTP pyrophosphatase (MazG superfamily)
MRMNFQHTETNLPLENEYPKLIRDKIPELVKQEGIVPSIRKIQNDEEFLEYILKKIVEEAQELSEAKTDSNILEEIADVYEIINALKQLKNLSDADIEAVQTQKRQKRGGFDERIIMLKTPR